MGRRTGHRPGIRLKNTIPSPCFVLCEKALEDNLQKLKNVAERSDIEIVLALKGFAMWSTFPFIRRFFSTASASSMHEVMLCNEFMKSKSHTYCVAYRQEEIEKILTGSSHIIFNSLEQVGRFSDLAMTKGVSVGIRINPLWSDVETALYNPSSPGSRLGISPEELKEGLPKGVDGLHFHVLCESDSHALEKVLASLEKNFGHLLAQIDWLNMGGGHLITRDNYDVDHLVKMLSDFQKKHKIRLILEPSSAFVWQAGHLVTTVLDVVDRFGTKTAIIDASFTCHMPDCLEMPYRPKVSQGSRDFNKFSHQFRLGGVSCLAGDFLEAYSFPQPLNVGDKLIFEDMIHYTMVKTTTFNGIQHPSIGILKKSGDFEMIRRFEYQDYRNRLS